MPSMFTVVSWLPVPLAYQATGPRATTINIGLTVISFLSRANVRAFHENPNRIHFELTFINP